MNVYVRIKIVYFVFPTVKKKKKMAGRLIIKWGSVNAEKGQLPVKSIILVTT